MIASSPLSRWVSIGESEGGLMPPSGIHVAFPPSLYPPRFSPVFARAVLCLILLRPRSPFTKISRCLPKIVSSELLLMYLTLITVDKTATFTYIKSAKSSVRDKSFHVERLLLTNKNFYFNCPQKIAKNCCYLIFYQIKKNHLN